MKADQPRPVIAILRFIAERPAGRPIRGADIPGLEAAGGSACIEWLIPPQPQHAPAALATALLAPPA